MKQMVDILGRRCPPFSMKLEGSTGAFRIMSRMSSGSFNRECAEVGRRRPRVRERVTEFKAVRSRCCMVLPRESTVGKVRYRLYRSYSRMALTLPSIRSFEKVLREDLET